MDIFIFFFTQFRQILCSLIYILWNQVSLSWLHQKPCLTKKKKLKDTSEERINTNVLNIFLDKCSKDFCICIICNEIITRSTKDNSDDMDQLQTNWHQPPINLGCWQLKKLFYAKSDFV